jgi:hypothetical protein
VLVEARGRLAQALASFDAIFAVAKRRLLQTVAYLLPLRLLRKRHAVGESRATRERVRQSQ